MSATRQACRICGCTETSACVNPHDGRACHWVTHDLCSACVERAVPTLQDAADLCDQYADMIREGTRDAEGVIADPAIRYELRCLALGAKTLRAATPPPSDHPRAALLIERIAAAYGLTSADLRGARRTGPIAFARHQAAWILVRRMGLDHAAAAQALHRGDATAIRYAVRAIDNRCETQHGFASRFADLTKTCLDLVSKVYP